MLVPPRAKLMMWSHSVPLAGQGVPSLMESLHLPMSRSMTKALSCFQLLGSLGRVEVSQLWRGGLLVESFTVAVAYIPEGAGGQWC